MGRKKKYLTDAERKEASNMSAMRYYERNKETIKKKNLLRYHNNKCIGENNDNLQNNKFN